MQTKSFNWPLIAILTSIAALNYCDRLAIAAVFPLLRADLGASDVMLGAIASAFLWSYAIGSPIVGWIADHISRTRMVLISLVAWSLVTMATGLAQSTNQLIAIRVLLGLAECAYIPAAVSLLADHHGSRQRGRAISIHTAGLGIGAIAGSTLAGFLGQRYGWRSTFLILGAAGIFLSFIAARVLRGQDQPVSRASSLAMQEAPETGGILRALLRVPSYWVLLVQSMILSIGIWLFLNWLPLYFTESFGMSLAGAGFYGAALLEFPLLFGVVAGGYLSDAVARRSSAGRMLVQMICYVIGSVLLLVFTRDSTFALVAAAVLGFSLMRSFAVANESPLLCDLLPSRQRSTAIGLMNSANTFAGGVGVFGAGVLKSNFGLSAIFAGVSGILLIAAAVNAFGYFFLLPRDLKRRADKIPEEVKI
ncbi:MAG: MFS transporter [Acidobacteriota bacterium]|nr:MFS transporter [Acidobacteriota bacterium]